MALRVQHLNADTTFLLTFSPLFAPDKTTTRFPGDFTILIDPWLNGPSSIFHPSFQVSHHVLEPAVASLKDIQEKVDLIIISQDKPDHCHRATLCSLPRNSKIRILATPTAAKKIKSWRHFDAGRIHAMKPYSASAADSVVNIPLPGYASASSGPGRVTIANIPTKRDMAGLHNVVGITYQPPSSTFTLNTQHGRYESGSTVQLSAKGLSRPSTAPRARTSSDPPPPTPLNWTSTSYRDRRPGKAPNIDHSRVDSGIVSSATNNEKTLSVLYTPHGLAPHLLKPYLTNHLTPLGALPVLALFHGMTAESNPWFMGGKVALGAPGGVQLAKILGGLQYWISAHDEEKENLGLATKWCKSRAYGLEEVSGMLAEAAMGETVVMRLGVGEKVKLPVKPAETFEMNGRVNKSMPNLRRPDVSSDATGDGADTRFRQFLSDIQPNAAVHQSAHQA